MMAMNHRPIPEVHLSVIIPNKHHSTFPADLELLNGTLHRIWLDADDFTIVRVEGETITITEAQTACRRYSRQVPLAIFKTICTTREKT